MFWLILYWDEIFEGDYFEYMEHNIDQSSMTKGNIHDVVLLLFCIFSVGLRSNEEINVYDMLNSVWLGMGSIMKYQYINS